jgi:hypothetical protein
MLSRLASHRTRIAIAASPAPRKTALIRKSMTIVALPPSITRAKPLPTAITSADAPMSASRRGANTAPATPITVDSASPSASTCTAARAAPSRSFSPMRRAIIAVAPMLSPIASA